MTIKKIIRAIKGLFVDDYYVIVFPGDFIAVSRDLYLRFMDVRNDLQEDCCIFTFFVPQDRYFAFCFRSDSEQLRKHPQLDAYPLKVDLTNNMVGFNAGKGVAASILNSYGLPYDKPARLSVKADYSMGYPVFDILPPVAR